MMQQPYYNTMYPQPSLFPTKTEELQQAEQYQLYKKAMNYDMPTIVQEQDKRK